MPEFVTVEVQGLSELQESLRQFTEKTAVSLVRSAVTAGTRVLGEAVQERTPVDTGLLKASVGIRVAVSKREQGAVGVVGFSGNQGFIARMVEFGHATSLKSAIGKRSSNAGHEIKHVPAHPFIRPAFDASKDEAVEAFIEVMKTGEITK